MSESLQQIQENIQVKVRDAGNTDVAHFGYKIVVATLTVTETVVFDPKYPVEHLAIARAKQQVLDKLYEKRHKEVSAAFFKFRKAAFGSSFWYDEKTNEAFDELAKSILGRNCEMPPSEYEPT